MMIFSSLLDKVLRTVYHFTTIVLHRLITTSIIVAASTCLVTAIAKLSAEIIMLLL